jgi:hypothetical protein
MFNISKNLKSFYSPKVGIRVPVDPNGIRILDMLPINGQKVFVVFSKTIGSYYTENQLTLPWEEGEYEVIIGNTSFPEYEVIEYYCKMWDINSDIGNLEENSVFLDRSLVYDAGNPLFFGSGKFYLGDGKLTYGVKSQITGNNEILVTWLKAELGESLMDPGFEIFI